MSTSIAPSSFALTQRSDVMRRSVFISAALAWCLVGPVAGQTPSSAPAAVNPTGDVSLRDALSLSLVQSPELLSFDAGRRAAEARPLQTRYLPNPVLNATLEDLGPSGAVSDRADVLQPQTTVQLSQLVELGGKRAARQRLAGLERDLATWDYEAARLDVLTRVSAAFLDVLGGQQAVAQAAQALGVAEQVRQTVAARVAAGVVSPIEETRANVLVANAQIDTDRARQILDAHRRQLVTHWGSTTATFTSATGDLEGLPVVPPLTALEAALRRNPDLARWVAEVEQRQAALALARSTRVPDVTISAGYRRFTSVDANAVVVGASVPLPWFDRNRGGIQAAEAAVDQAHHAARAAELNLVARLAEAYGALASAQGDLTTLRSRVVPGARAVFDAVREGYELGRFGLMDVLDAQRTLVDANGRYLQALTTFHRAVITVERLAGPLADAAPGSK